MEACKLSLGLRRWVFFGAIGLLAFVVDACVFMLIGQLIPGGSHGADGHIWRPMLQRCIGFSAGITTTYQFNCILTFRVRPSWARYWRYVISQFPGTAVNLILFLGMSRFYPVQLSFVVATSAAMACNFKLASWALKSIRSFREPDPLEK